MSNGLTQQQVQPQSTQAQQSTSVPVSPAIITETTPASSTKTAVPKVKSTNAQQISTTTEIQQEVQERLSPTVETGIVEGRVRSRYEDGNNVVQTQVVASTLQSIAKIELTQTTQEATVPSNVLPQDKVSYLQKLNLVSSKEQADVVRAKQNCRKIAIIHIVCLRIVV